jgi:hypothetical protein
VELYILTNAHKNLNNQDIIAWVLSYLTKGGALQWRNSFLADKKKKGTPGSKTYDLGKFADFKKEIKKTFFSANTA